MAEKKIRIEKIGEEEKSEQHPDTQDIAAEEEAEIKILNEQEEAVEELADVPEVELSPEEIVALQESLAQGEAKAAEYLDGWQRARAEFVNYKKRVERDRQQIYQEASARVIKRYLEILDDLERALNDRPQEGQGAAWAEGIQLIYQKIGSFLDAEGVKPIQTQGELFDPNLHEAIAQTESDDHESGEIIEVMQRGYLIGDRVLRPAIVRVAA
jgi:molecular chaperone GrpE